MAAKQAFPIVNHSFRKDQLMTNEQFRFICACILASAAEPPQSTVGDLNGYFEAVNRADWQAAFPVLAAADAPAVAAPGPDLTAALAGLPGVAGQIAAILSAIKPTGRGPVPTP